MKTKLATSLFISLTIAGNCFASDADDFIGTWLFDAIEIRNESGDWVPSDDPRVGSDPVGYISYDSDGYMSVQLTRRERTGSNTDYIAYFGTYEVLEIEGIVIHHTIGNLLGEPGSDQRRGYILEGDTLTLLSREGRRLRWKKP